MKKPIFIAEIKTKSMFGFESRYNRESLMNTAIEYGDWLSIHTDPRFGGSFDDIYRARQLTGKPILAKGFHCHNDDAKKAIELGADYVLVVDRLHRALLESPPYQDKVLFELSSVQNLHKISYDFRERGKFVYNGRNLNNGMGKKYIGDYTQYREAFNWLCGASLIRTPEDVAHFYPNCDAFIVGENLINFCKDLKAKTFKE